MTATASTTARKSLLLGASLTALIAATPAAAQDQFVRRADPAAQAAQAARNAGAQAASAQAIANRTLEAFSRAAAAHGAMQAAQAAARAAAASSQAALAVPNGLGRGGLQVAAGANFDTSAITAANDPRLALTNLWVGAKAPTETRSGTTVDVRIEQTQQKAILSWESFNVGKDTTVHFDQRAGGANAAEWIALNRVTDPTGDPSRIFGKIKAEGQVYLVNRNGIVFGGTAQVNVRGLAASALDIGGATLAERNKRFIDGILTNPNSQTQAAVLAFGERFEALYPTAFPNSPNPAIPANVVSLPGEILTGQEVVVDAGAQIATGMGGRAMLLGHSVINRGTIESPEGQVLLAAGRGIYLARNAAPESVQNTPFDQVKADPDIRGLVSNVNRGGRVENRGIVSSDRGNVTLNGKSVLQAGIAQATTSASLNGTLIFRAGDATANGVYPQPAVFGDLTLGRGSVSQVIPDANGETVAGFGQFRSSEIDLTGRTIVFESGSTVYAPNARMKVVAQRGAAIPLFERDPVTGLPLRDPDNSFAFLQQQDDGRIYIDTGAIIDLGGLRNVVIPADRNTIQGELRANELADNPILRDSLLRGRTVFFDARRGTELANLTGYYDLVERGVGERMVEGGELQLNSSTVITRAGSTIDLSGGSLNYAPGFVRSTLLVDRNGNVVAIEDAKVGVEYVGLYGDTVLNHRRWGVTETFSSPFYNPLGKPVAGYVEGRSAGSLAFGNGVASIARGGESDFRILDGNIVADVVVGQNQREAPSGATAADVTRIWRERPQGASLTMGSSSTFGSGETIYAGGNIVIGEATALAPGFTATSALDPEAAYNHRLSSRYFDGETFTRVRLFSGTTEGGGEAAGSLVIEAGAIVDLGDFGAFTFGGESAEIEGGIRAPNGTISIRADAVARADRFTLLPDWTKIAAADRPRITLTGELDVAGRWVNDVLTLVDRPAKAIDGGRVSLVTAGDLTLAEGSLIDASGGGHLAADGLTVTAGDGGAIVLVNNIKPQGVANGPLGSATGNLTLGGDLRGFALGQGADLTISTGSAIAIGEADFLTDGFLEAGQEAKADFALALDTVFPAGSFVPVETTVSANTITPGVPTPVALDIFYNPLNTAPFGPLVVQRSWTVPAGLTVRDTTFRSYGAGQTVPAGTRLNRVNGRALAGTIFPDFVFPVPLTVARYTIVTPPGVQTKPVTIAAGTIIPKGVVLDQRVEARLLTLSPDLFRDNGFSGIAVAGADGLTVMEGTKIESRADSYLLDDLGRQIASGAKLHDLARRGALPATQPRPTTVALTTQMFDLDTDLQAEVFNSGLAEALGRVVLSEGTEIRAPEESRIRLVAQGANSFNFNRVQGRLLVDGLIATPGGDIRLGGDDIALGSGAQLLAPGYLKTSFDGVQQVRSVEAGGSVVLSLPRNVPTAEGFRGGRLFTHANSVIDVSGVSGVADLLRVGGGDLASRGRYVPRQIDGAGGAITIGVSEGVLAGTLNLAAGGESARGGLLRIGTTGTFEAPANIFQIGQTLTEGMIAAVAKPNGGFTSIAMAADRLNASGADELLLRGGSVRFEGDVTLQGGRFLEFDVSRIVGAAKARGDVIVRADHVAMAPSQGFSFDASTAGEDLAGSFRVEADLIDIGTARFGCAAFDCNSVSDAGAFETVDFVSRGDIRLHGGDIAAPGDLTFTAAQVFIGSDAEDRVASTIASGTSVSFLSNGAAVRAPLTFGGSLTVLAPEILQAGVLRAPYGAIQLQATESVIFAPGSLTTVSLEGVIVPVRPDFQAALPTDPFNSLVPPANAVRADAPEVTIAGGAVIDVSGGGDLTTYSFAAGNGGTRNLLDPALGYFAVAPSVGGGLAPLLDRSSTQGPGQITRFQPRDGYRVGDQVYLAGVKGLADGVYTLLPSDYAQIPGAVLIRPAGANNLAARPDTVARDDGTQIVGGYLSDAAGRAIGNAGHARFEVLTKEVYSQYSELRSQTFSQFVDDANRRAAELALGTNITPVVRRSNRDAGSLILAATEELVLDGTGRFAAGQGGLLGNLDIASAKIAITGGGGEAPEDFLAIDAKRLSGFGAGSLFIGGSRANTSEGTVVTVTASDVLIDNDAASALTGPDILLAASDTLTLTDGSVVSATGATSADANPLLVSGDGALVRLSTGRRVPISRSGASGTAGTLDLSAGARLAAAGSLSLDASDDILIDPTTTLEAAQLDLSSTTISLGDAPADAAGTVLSNAALAKLAGAEDLLLRASLSIDLYGGAVLGGRDPTGRATLGSVTLDTGLLQGRETGDRPVAITARDIVLRNSGDAATAAPDLGAGRLALAADNLILGPGDVDVGGFAAVAGDLGALRGTGKGSVDIAGDASMTTRLVTAAANSDIALRATGNLSLLAKTGAAAPVEDFGGRMAIAGDNVRIDTLVAMPAGIFEATAAGDLSLGADALLDVSGVTVAFRDVVRHAGGGTVRLAAGGNINQDAGAIVDVSADTRGGHAGRIDIAAGGVASLGGEARGSAANGFRTGNFALTAGSVSDFARLNAALETGKLNQTRAIRVATGDLTLAAGQAITAHDVLLRTDGGLVSIAGTIDARGTAADADGGSIRLIGGNGVSLAGTARLDARAGAVAAGEFAADSGDVELAAAGGRLTVAAGAVIDVSGGKQGGGTILVRADRVGGDIAIDALAGSFVGARERAVAGVATYQTSAVTAAQRDLALAEAAAWAANAPAIAVRLGGGFAVRPGIEFRSTGNLAIGTDIDLAGARYAGAPGYLDFVAAGDIAVNGTISDGFASAARTAALLTGPSWSYGFEAGRDLTLGAGRMVRTGTGDIRIDAGRDLVFANNLSVLYTAGSKTATDAGFTPVTGLPTGEFPTQGGDIHLSAGRDILAPITRQAASNWLFRHGKTNWNGSSATSTVAQQTSWSIVFKNFEQGVGALGGGNVDIAAGRDTSQIAVSLPTTGHMTTRIGNRAEVEDVRVRGGGDLSLRTGRDLLGGVFFLGRGEAEVEAGGELRASDTLVTIRDNFGNFTGQTKVGALFGLMDATAAVVARQSIAIDGAFDPIALQRQVQENTGNISGMPTAGSYFNSHTERTALELTSLSGDVVDRGDPLTSTYVTSDNAVALRIRGADIGKIEPQRQIAQLSRRAPGTVKLAALQGDVTLGNASFEYAMSPANNGQLELLAAGDLIGGNNFGRNPVFMIDRDEEYRRGPTDSYGGLGTLVNFRDVNESTNFDRGFTVSHAQDTQPVRIYALGGNNSIRLDAPKPVTAYAGLDFTGLVIAQNNRAEHISSITAGRDIVVPTASFFDSNLGDYTAAKYEGLNVSGPGLAIMEAGRHVDAGVISAGNRPGRGLEVPRVDFATGLPTSFIPPPEQPLTNAALPERGAEVFIVAGTAKPTDYAAFAAAYLDPANGGDVVRTYLPELGDYMRQLGFDGLSGAELTAAFGALPVERQKPLLQQIFFTELKETGLDVTNPESPRFQNYDRGYAAIKRLFPLDPTKLAQNERADIRANARQIETQAGGNITVLAPYGKIDVGSPIPVRGALPEQGGIITRRGGDIRIMADDDIALYISRVFTLQGGDITMWTSNGDITAGAGAKTSGLRPPLIYEVDNDGNVSLNAFGLQTGAGIGVLDVGGTGSDQRKRSRLDLIAPRGEVNAGDAGIRVVGDLNIAALRVVGLDNIQVSGEATGLPEVVQANVGALTAASSASAAVSEAAEAVAERAQQTRPVREVPSIITGRVLGFGEG